MIHLADATHVDNDTPRSRIVGIVAGNPAECLAESLHGGEIEIAISSENDTLPYTLLLRDTIETSKLVPCYSRTNSFSLSNLVADVTGFRPGGLVRQQ